MKSGKKTESQPLSDNASESSSSSVDEDTLSDLLANMDIDKDFNIWTSFRSSISGRRSSASSPGANTSFDGTGEFGQEVSLGSTGEAALVDKTDASEKPSHAAPRTEASSDPLEEQDKAWAQRLKREEIYSHRYRPSQAEIAELEELEVTLGIKRRSSRRGLFSRTSSTDSNAGTTKSQTALWNQLAHPDTSKKQPYSILLKRGPCLWQEGTEKDGFDNSELRNNDTEEVECELILLTHGLVVATILTAKPNQRSKVIPRQFSRAILLSHVKYVQPRSDTMWQIILNANGSQEVWTFVCPTAKQQQHWLKAMERVIIQHHMHAGPQPALGWQYRYIYKPAFSMAVTGHVDNIQPPASSLAKLDRYQGYAPLHYAVRCQNVNAVRSLLSMGADPNQQDQEGHTPMEYALRDPAPPEIQDLLVSHGGRRTDWADDKGALFGQVAAVEEKRENSRRELEQKKQAEAAQHQMNQNMQLLQERGEKIEELGSKAADLNQGAQDYASMAKQLKERSKKGSSWLPF